MNIKNTKNAIIILLVIANIFFIYNIIELNVKTNNIPSAMIENAASIVNKNGLSVDRNAIPAKKPANYIYEGAYSINIFKEIIKSFSGISEEEIKDGYPLLPNKTRYNAGNYIFILAETDYLKISIMDKSHEKANEYYKALEEETEKEMESLISEEKTRINGEITGVSKSEIKKTETIIRDFIKKYEGADVKSDFIILNINSDDSNNSNNANKTEKVIINQTVDGLPVDSHIVYAEIKNEEVKYFYGRWYFGAFTAKYKMPLLDSINILFKCLDKDGSIVSGDKLEKMDLEYTVLQHDTEKFKFYLTPSWSLNFGSGKKLSYNMVTGNKNDKIFGN